MYNFEKKKTPTYLLWNKMREQSWLLRRDASEQVLEVRRHTKESSYLRRDTRDARKVLAHTKSTNSTKAGTRGTRKCEDSYENIKKLFFVLLRIIIKFFRMYEKNKLCTKSTRNVEKGTTSYSIKSFRVVFVFFAKSSSFRTLRKLRRNILRMSS